MPYGLVNREPQVRRMQDEIVAADFDGLCGQLLDCLFRPFWRVGYEIVLENVFPSSTHGRDDIAARLEITGRNSSGRLVFTPDATREEAERFVRGLNNTIHKMERKENWPFPAPLDR